MDRGRQGGRILCGIYGRYPSQCVRWCFRGGAVAVPTADDVSLACSSGDMTISLADGYAASCSGDFGFSGGRLSSDAWIRLSAGGGLRLDGVILEAPRIELSAGTIAINDGVTLDTGGRVVVLSRGDRSSFINGGSIVLNGGVESGISVGSGIIASSGGGLALSGGPFIVPSVPEAPSPLMWLLGMAVLAGLSRRRAMREPPGVMA